MIPTRDLPIIDWTMALKVSGNNQKLANDILAMLVQSLPTDVQELQTLHQQADYQTLLKKLHQLHGALCYTGLPRLKNIVNTLETQLKNHIMDDSPNLLNQLKDEVDLFLEHNNALQRND